MITMIKDTEVSSLRQPPSGKLNSCNGGQGETPRKLPTPTNDVDSHMTDLLFGIKSVIPGSDKHFFLGDFDIDDDEFHTGENLLMERVGNVLFNKYLFGTVYMSKTGKGYHLACFSVGLPLDLYVTILKEMKADDKYIEWVEKVKYGVLRLSRRSSHHTVPALYRVLLPPWSAVYRRHPLYTVKENTFSRDFYINLLRIEQGIEKIVRVRVCD
jgi:hypothetical protein